MLCHPLKEIGTGTTQKEGIHQNHQASHTAILLHNNNKGQLQVAEPWHVAQPAAESSKGIQLPSGVQCAPTYCTLEPGSSSVAIGLRNISSQSIIVPFRVVVGQLQQATIQTVQASGKQNKQGSSGGRRRPGL